MKITLPALLLTLTIFACSKNKDQNQVPDNTSITGTWNLVSSKIISKGDTVNTFPVKNQVMIKMFTDKEFSFFKHDLSQGKGDTAVFDAGSGTYELQGENYTEHLAYCSARAWENMDFHFKLQLRNDTLIQTGIEKIDSLNIDQEIREIYVRKK